MAPPAKKGQGGRRRSDAHQWPLSHGVVEVVVVRSLSVVGAVVDVSVLSGAVMSVVVGVVSVVVGVVSVVVGVVSVGAALVPPLPVGAGSLVVVVPTSLGAGCVVVVLGAGCVVVVPGSVVVAPGAGCEPPLP
jgi:hypothetical protein